MGVVVDLTGKKFGRLTVLSRAENNAHGKAQWLCHCECGKEVVIIGQHIRNGNSKSCGCLNMDRITKHGGHKTRLHQIWLDMRFRCRSKTCKYYKDYGGRGIKVCERWDDFKNFRDDMQEGYADHLTLDRIDVNGDYEPSNCRWATVKEQNRNMRKCVYVDTPWGPLTAGALAEKIGMSKSGVRHRIMKGLTGPELWEAPKSVK